MPARYWIAISLAATLGLPASAGAGSRSVRGGHGIAFDHYGDQHAEWGQGTPCRKTANLARAACRNDVRDDYLTTLGGCLNLGDPDGREECKSEAGDTWAEEWELCGDRFDARRELCDRLEEDRYDPEIDPASFVSPEEMAANPNPFFPLVPGNSWVYESDEERTEVTVTGETREILGVECVEVRDTVALKDGGEVIEDTLDWYALDLEGNLWYFGEVAQNFEDGVLHDLDGSWLAGEDLAKPGIVLPVSPAPGQIYRQEFLLREAEDVAEVLSVTADEFAPAASCSGGCLQTLEYTPLEPDVFEHKFYVPGVGLILEVDLEDGARNELVSFSLN